MLSEQNTAMNWNLSLITACIIVPECKNKVLKHWKSYKNTYILQESFAMTDKSYPPPCRNYLQPLYLSVTLYACAQRDIEKDDIDTTCTCNNSIKARRVSNLYNIKFLLHVSVTWYIQVGTITFALNVHVVYQPAVNPLQSRPVHTHV